MEVEPFLQIPADRIRDQDTEFARLANQRQRFPQLLLRPSVGRNDGNQRNLSAPLLPVAPGPKDQSCNGERAQHPPDPSPPTRNLDRRLDVAQVVGASRGRERLRVDVGHGRRSETAACCVVRGACPNAGSALLPTMQYASRKPQAMKFSLRP